jgi:predicted GNAT superfamily acetyltransferase
VVALGISDDGRPVPGRLDGAISLVAVPRDIERYRAADPVMAHEWRIAVRETLTTLVGGGGRIDDFDRSGWYVVRTSR